MARPHIEPFVDRDVPWKKMTLPGFPKGMRYKMLSVDPANGACSMTVMFEAGYRQPPGMSYTEYELFVMKGSIQVGDKVHGPGSYFFVPAGVAIGELSSARGATGLLFWNHGEPSWVESDSDHPRADRDDFKVLSSYDDMTWSGTNIYPATAPGCLVKNLHFDQRTQAFTFLYCMTPNFAQDNISYHDCIEEAYHIWGDSWMMQFGTLPTGGYFYRPPYINHGAFRSDLGILAIGRTDSQLYNHFHFNPWTTPEENRERAANRILQWKPELYKWINQEGHNHPVDFEFPHDHGHSHGDSPHHHGDGEVAHAHAKRARRKK
jgi:hypothetical protein